MKKKKKSKYLVRGAKEECERSIALNMKGDNKIFWKYIQSKTNTKENIPCIMDENAELLNNFFKSVFTTDSTQGIPPFSTTTIHNLEIVKFDSIKRNKILRSRPNIPKILERLQKILQYHWRKFLIHQWKPVNTKQLEVGKYNTAPQERAKKNGIKLLTNQFNICRM
jgi:hypothetical protein